MLMLVIRCEYIVMRCMTSYPNTFKYASSYVIALRRFTLCYIVFHYPTAKKTHRTGSGHTTHDNVFTPYNKHQHESYCDTIDYAAPWLCLIDYVIMIYDVPMIMFNWLCNNDIWCKIMLRIGVQCNSTMYCHATQ